MAADGITVRLQVGDRPAIDSRLAAHRPPLPATLDTTEP